MNISAWAIKHPTPVILFFTILVITGLMNFSRLGINDNPNVDFPLIVVGIAQPGAAPTELETDVTKKVEDALVALNGIEHITSTVTDGFSSTVIEFKIGWPTDTALNDVRDAVSKIRQSLPQDINEPSITHPNQSGEPFIAYSLESSKRSVEELSHFVDDTIGRTLLTIPGVSQVRRSGGLDREVKVELNPDRMKALGVTADQVNNQIKALNINLPGGKAEAGGQEQTIRTIGSALDIEALKNLQIVLPTGQSARLDTLGTIADSTAEVRQVARFDGRPVVSFSVVRAQGSSIVTVEELVKKKVAELEKTMPPDMHITLIRTAAKFIKNRYTASVDALLLGAFLAIIVIYIFLRNWQATLIGALAIPLSILGTFMVMNWLGYTLNFLTMLGLILVVGILVDDAIVDLENIHRHIAMGKKPYQAAMEATNEIGLAIVATTSTIVAVFIPVAFMGGIPGQFFRAFGITVSVAVLFSLLVARTLTPMMAAYMLPDHSKAAEGSENQMKKVYKVILDLALKHRWVASLGSFILIFAISAVTLPHIPKTFFEQGDVSEASISVTLPTGSTLEDTKKVIASVSDILAKRPEINHVYSSIGSGVQVGLIGTGGAVNSGTVSIVMVPPKERKLSQSEFEQDILPALAEIPGARIAFNHFGAGGGAKPVNIILRGNDNIMLNKAASNLLSEMRRKNELRDVTSSTAELRPEIIIKPDFQRAADQGVSVFTIARIARIATQGDIDVNMPKFNSGDRQINIRVKLQESIKGDVESIGNLLVPGKNGLIPIKTVSDIFVSSGPVQINRYDRARQVTISANLNGVALGTATEMINNIPIMKNLPPGVTSGSVGEAKVMQDVFGEFSKAIGSAVLFIYAVLVLLFGSFLHPMTIMVALPLSIGGAMLGLLIGGKSLGLMSLIGIIMLMGIVTKNSILLVEYGILLEHSGMPRRDAIISAGLARLRPIIMTTIAMISGMLPIALSMGAGTETQSPMAVAVIGGLITSTIFTLVVVPAIYTIIDDIRKLAFRFLSRKRKKLPEINLEKEVISTETSAV
jgi:HAE1 family hydrophobic/amphiphilic exporter-1